MLREILPNLGVYVLFAHHLLRIRQYGKLNALANDEIQKNEKIHLRWQFNKLVFFSLFRRYP